MRGAAPRVLGLLLAATGLAGCGQKGPLVLPPSERAPAAAAAAPARAASAPAAAPRPATPGTATSPAVQR